ncbi:MAG: LysR family transcriptional regulator [Pseudomonadales bacterium]|nr:LysR family transcriptional regulator [Pseudomonadales bacterium]
MRQLNYNHLQYFHAIAREGSMARAAKSLHLTPQTLSGQLKLLEAQCGAPLFVRTGRHLVLTELGRVVERYADEIFTLGAELARVVRSGAPDRELPLNVGVSQTIPKVVAYRMLAPAFELETPVRVLALERPLRELLGELALHRLDLVLSDQPMPPGLSVRAFSHELGRCGLSFFGRDALGQGDARTLLAEAPLLLPCQGTPVRTLLDDWFAAAHIAPRIRGEFDDSALLKIFGMRGLGLFPSPSAIEEEICEMYSVQVACRLEGIEQAFYALSTEQRLVHPGVIAITEAARRELFVPRTG